VAFTNRSNSAFVTGVRSIHNPSTETRCAGSASGMPQPSHPIQNVPPAIHTMFAGAAARGDRQPAIAIETTTRTIEATGRMRTSAAFQRGITAGARPTSTHACVLRDVPHQTSDRIDHVRHRHAARTCRIDVFVS
jgi:hypothetical protein